MPLNISQEVVYMFILNFAPAGAIVADSVFRNFL